MTTMKLNPRNKQGYLQAAISVLIIFSVTSNYFLYIQSGDIYSYQHYNAISFIPLLSYWHEEKVVYYNIAFIIFILMQLTNIFYQSKRKNKTLSTIASVSAIIMLIIYYRILKEDYKDQEMQIIKGGGYYLILALIATQIISNLTPNLFFSRLSDFISSIFHDEPCETPQEQPLHKELGKSGTSAIKKERLEKELLEKEFRTLKAKVEQVEKNRLEREKLKQEKEKLTVEIAKLKDMLMNSEESDN